MQRREILSGNHTMSRVSFYRVIGLYWLKTNNIYGYPLRSLSAPSCDHSLCFIKSMITALQNH